MAQYVPLSEAPWQIDWMRGELERLLHLVYDRLCVSLPSISGRHTSSWPRTDADPWHFRFGVDGAGLRSELCAAPTPDGVHLHLRSESESEADEVQQWLDAVLSALERFTEAVPVLNWWAAIAGSAESSQPVALAGGCVIDKMTLTPAATAFTEICAPEIPQMAAGELRSLMPVVVHGAANAHAFDAARESAAQSLARLCALLSVATDHVWEVIETPRADPLDPAGLPLSRLPLPPYPEPDSPDLVELPEWVASASDLLPVGSLLALALGAHHQGMLMERRFPSYSMIAYTGAIETIGKFLLPDRDAGVQYRAALKRIRSSSARQPFVKSYDLRSRTAHSGVLHAGEDLRGSLPAGAWIPRPDPSWTFRLLPLAESRRASRELLVLAATNQLD